MRSKPLARIAAAMRRLAGDRAGSAAVFVAAGVFVMAGAVGLATDAARGYLVKARLSQALDAAALAGGRAMFSPDRDADIRMYFNANFPPGYLGATVSGPIIVPDADGEVLTLSASATVPTTLMKVLGLEHMTVASATEVTRQTQLLDVVLSIDMSGSMSSSAGGGLSRIQAARAAATEMVNILFGDDSIKNLLKIGLVPWNSKVNVMERGVPYDSAATTSQTVPPFTNPLTGAVQSTVWYANNSSVPLLSAPAASWQGCVFARYLDNGVEDDADVVEGAYSSPAGDWFAWEPIGPEGEPVSGWGRCALSVSNQECTPCLDHGVTPLQSAKQTILDAIDELRSPTGNTDIPQGLAWAWRVLTPAAPFEEADPNPPGRRQQAIVLLTDGENVGGSGDGYKGVFGIGSDAQDDMDARLRLLAANIKAQGIKIYTIQFANNGTAMQALLKEIASGPDAPYYNYAPDAATLQQIFREVANNLSELRLSK